jgi:hypothetical protein
LPLATQGSGRALAPVPVRLVAPSLCPGTSGPGLCFRFLPRKSPGPGVAMESCLHWVSVPVVGGPTSQAQQARDQVQTRNPVAAASWWIGNLATQDPRGKAKGRSARSPGSEEAVRATISRISGPRPRARPPAAPRPPPPAGVFLRSAHAHAHRPPPSDVACIRQDKASQDEVVGPQLRLAPPKPPLLLVPGTTYYR